MYTQVNLNKKTQYQVIYESIKDKIDAEVYSIGDHIPSENDLCKSFNTTRPTVRQALSLLVKNGYIKRIHGKGSIVIEKSKTLGILSIKGTTSGQQEELLETIVIKKPESMSWPKDFPFQIDESVQSLGCIYFERLRKVNGELVVFEKTYLTNLNIPRFTSRNLNNTSLFEVLSKHHGVEVEEGVQNISAIKANKEIASLLEIEVGSPLVYLQRRIDTSKKGFTIYSFVYCNSDKYTLQSTF